MKTPNITHFKLLSGSALKLIACFSMLSDHLARFYLVRYHWVNIVWFSFLGKSISLIQLMTMFGRFAFPIFVFLLVVGFEKTSNRTRYGISLFVLALLSEIPFNLMHSSALFFQKQNVMFTLLLGFFAMCSLDYFKDKPFVKLASLVCLFLVSRYLHADYQSAGFVFILLIYGLRKERIIQCVAAPVLLQMKMMVFLSLSLTLLYNGKRGFIRTLFLKYFFYAFYPLHMLIIYFLAR